eukprot:m.309414 g.309414  ORF g.309414 m.309414 type:complete len:495 (+) comp22995_c0_seq1:64-1548(+)
MAVVLCWTHMLGALQARTAGRQLFTALTRHSPAASDAASAFSCEIARLGLGRNVPVAVAVSGGVDSMALLSLAHGHFSRVTALTVDHALRPESSREAAEVGSWLAARGWQHKVARLDWPARPSHGRVMAEARALRYESLLRAAVDHGCATILVAHHLDDQLETLLHRLSRQSSLAGLGGMRAVQQQLVLGHSKVQHITLVRPLLGLRKAALIAHCLAHNVPWVEDPTNQNLTFRRNAVRRALALTEAADPEFIADMTSLHYSLAQTAASLSAQVAKLAARCIHWDVGTGACRVDAHALDVHAPSHTVLLQLLSDIMQCVSGSMHPPRRRATAAVREFLASSIGTKHTRLTTGGCIVQAESSDDVTGQRFIIHASPVPRKDEIAACLAADGPFVHWQNRFAIRIEASASGLQREGNFSVRHCRKQDRGRLGKEGVRIPSACIEQGLPVVVDGSDRVIAVPHAPWTAVTSGITVVCHWLPKVPPAGQAQTFDSGSD